MEIVCTNCQAKNPAEMKFCLECGARLPARCEQCGLENPAAAKFCGHCGSKIAAGTISERRQLTVLFCDLVGSTRLSEQLDPEDFRELVQIYQSACGEAISGLEGHIAQFLGDGILAYFCYPTAHEDDARRAVEAALRILDKIAQLKVSGRTLQVRIGIHTGVVVVGGLGAGGNREKLALGETPNLAARIQAEAQANEILVSEASRQLLGAHFQVEPLPARVLKGLSRETVLYRVVGRSAALTLEASLPVAHTPFMGRKPELRMLQDCWRKACERQPQIVHLSAEAGLGKSRLVAELAGEARRSGAVVRTCRCSPYHRNSAFYPLIGLLSQVLGFARQEPLEDKRAKLKAFLEELGLQGTPEPYFALGSLLEIGETQSSLKEMTPQRRRQLTLETLVTLFRARGAREPLLFIAEDLHWADPSTLEVLATVAATQETVSILLLLSYRPEFQPSWERERRPNETVLQLKPFSPAETEVMVRRVAHGKRMPPKVLEQICARSEGIPLFIEEVTKVVLESGALRESEEAYELAGEIPNGLIPATVLDSLTARLDRLGESREILRLASVVGREFSYRLLQAVAASSGQALEHALKRAEEAELIYCAAPLPDAQYAFKHALIRDAAYGSLFRKARQQYHDQVARTLAAKFPEIAEVQPELLATHFDSAEEPGEAVGYWLSAGRRGLERAAYHEAMAHLDAGLGDVEKLPENPERQKTELAIRLSSMAGHMAIRGWSSQEVEQCSLRARDLSLQLSDSQSLFGSLWGLWTVHFLRGEHHRAILVAQEVLKMALGSGIPMLERLGRHAVCGAHFFRGELSQAREHAERGIALFDMETERVIVNTFQSPSNALMRMFLGASLWMMGRPDEAESWMLSGLELARELNNVACTANVLGVGILLFSLWGDLARIRSCAQELLPLCQQEGFLLWHPVAQIYLGWAETQDGDALAGVEEMQRGLEGVQRMNAEVPFVQEMVLLAEALRKTGHEDEAEAALNTAMVRASHQGHGLMLPEAYRIRGEIRLDAGNKAGALEDMDEAIRIAEIQCAHIYKIRAESGKQKIIASQFENNRNQHEVWNRTASG